MALEREELTRSELGSLLSDPLIVLCSVLGEDGVGFCLSWVSYVGGVEQILRRYLVIELYGPLLR